MKYTDPSTLPEFLRTMREVRRREYRSRAAFHVIARYFSGRAPEDAEVSALHAALIEHWSDDTIDAARVAALVEACGVLDAAMDAPTSKMEDADRLEDELGELVVRLSTPPTNLFQPKWTVNDGSPNHDGFLLGEPYNSALIVADALNALHRGHRVRYCQRCEYPFIAPRATSVYCSPNCKSMAATERQRSKGDD